MSAKFLSSPRATRIASQISALLLLGVFAAYLGNWVYLNWPMLTDVRLQNDDARTTLFPLHRYGPAQALGDDPIASEMLGFLPWGVRLVYQALVPFTDIYLAAKIVQALALGVVLIAAMVLARSRRAGVAIGVLLVFVVLHDWFAINRIAGGLPRGFGFPCFALWLAGVLAQNRAARYAAPVVAALTYPSAMVLILAADGLYTLRGATRMAPGVVLRRLRRYVFVVGVCLLASLPAVMGDDDRGPIHTLEEAKKEPAFGRRGRLWILPFADPAHAMSDALVDSFKPRGGSPIPALKSAAEDDPKMVGFVVLALFACIPLFGLAPVPRSALSFLVGSVILYFLSRWLAFRLYSPERYYSFGMRMVAEAFVVASLAHAFYWLKPRWRVPARNLLVSAAIFGVWAVSGNGVVHNNGMEIDSRKDADLYSFVRTLPKDVRFAGHLLDTDGIPFYSARATMGGFETLQPWFKDSWARQKARMTDTLTALYSTDRQAVLAYADKHGVTHILINKRRYGSRLARSAGSFEPFTQLTKRLLRGKKPKQMVMGRVPKKSIVFRKGRWQVVSVAKLRQAWAAQEK